MRAPRLLASLASPVVWLTPPWPTGDGVQEALAQLRAARGRYLVQLSLVAGPKAPAVTPGDEARARIRGGGVA